MIAVGTEPARPADVPFTPNRVIDSTELLTLATLPRSMTIVGGGVIGTEYACMLAAVGVRVTLVDRAPGSWNSSMTSWAKRCSSACVTWASACDWENRSRRSSSTRMASKPPWRATKSIHTQTLLYAIGRQGATEKLNLGAAGLSADNRGRLKVNEWYQTQVPHIYAAGDVIGFPALAATSMEQGRVAASHIFHQLAEQPSALFPYGIYAIPEISMVGATEQSLTQQGTPYEVGLARYREIARGQLIADPFGLLKLLFHPQSRRLLGVHAIGTGATELIHIGQAVMAAGMPIDYFIESVFNYPTLAECYKVAALDGINRCRSIREFAPEPRRSPPSRRRDFSLPHQVNRDFAVRTRRQVARLCAGATASPSYERDILRQGS